MAKQKFSTYSDKVSKAFLASAGFVAQITRVFSKTCGLEYEENSEK
jgi:hypothetical protein